MVKRVDEVKTEQREGGRGVNTDDAIVMGLVGDAHLDIEVVISVHVHVRTRCISFLLSH